MKINPSHLLHLPLLAAVATSLSLLTAPPAAHAEPYNEDEWYDPSDWFDGNNYEYDDTYNYGSYGSTDRDYGYGSNYRSNYGSSNYGSDYRDYTTRDYTTPNSNSYWRDTYDYDASSTNRSTTSRQSGQQRTIAGTVDGFREVNVRDRKGAQDRYTVVRLRMRDGRSATVDLGQRLSLRDVNLEKGDYVSVSGRERMISGQNVILADTVYADGRHHRITRSGQSSSRITQQTAQTQNSTIGTSDETLRGTVESFQRVNVQGSPTGHTLAKLTMENGSSKIVDFGPNQTPRSLGINTGDYVSVRGNRTEFNNRAILSARSVYADGGWKNIRQIDWRNDDNQRQQTQQ